MRYINIHAVFPVSKQESSKRFILTMNNVKFEKRLNCSYQSRTINVSSVLDRLPSDFWIQAPEYQNIKNASSELLENYPLFKLFYGAFFEPEKNKAYAFEPGEAGISEQSKTPWVVFLFPFNYREFRFDWEDKEWYRLNSKFEAWVKDTSGELETSLENLWIHFRSKKQREAVVYCRSQGYSKGEFIEKQKHQREVEKINAKLELITVITNFSKELNWSNKIIQGLSPSQDSNQISDIRTKLYNISKKFSNTLATMYIPQEIDF